MSASSARVQVSLAALIANYRLLCANAHGEVACTVKANAYGMGLAPVAQALAEAGCQRFFVANAIEGLQLRTLLGSAEIYVLEGARAETVAILLEGGLIPVISSLHQAERWASDGQAQPAALHIDTGMERLGLDVRDCAALLSSPYSADLNLITLMTHFARADQDDPKLDAPQLAAFAEVLAQLRKTWPDAHTSLTNSAGLMRGLGPETFGRAGIALYGGNPFADQANPMHTVATLQGQVLQVRTPRAGAGVGYGHTYQAADGERIAIVGIGYADGYPRVLSNIGVVSADGHRLPVVGRICMDMLHCADDGAVLAEGDWVELFGEALPLDDVAALAQTFSYEMLVSIGARVERIYS